MAGVPAWLCALALLSASMAIEAASSGPDAAGPASDRPTTTYERFLPLAVAGDPAVQHFLGYMFFYGEGVEQNYDEAHHWFHLAAEEGDSIAQRNLGLFHAGAIARIPPKFHDAEEANLWFSLAATNPENGATARLASRAYGQFLRRKTGPGVAAENDDASGKNLFQGQCAGCHGFTGRGAYDGAPSFARGDRLDRDDGELIEGILHGHGSPMRGDASLGEDSARRLVAYIRAEFGVNSARATGERPDSDPPSKRQLLPEERIYLEFCGGCHGFNGIAWYVNSPSFALRERMDKSDAELAASIRNGRGAMPSWEYMLKHDQIDSLVRFIRTLGPRYEQGIFGELRRPENFLRFRPDSEIGPDWSGGDIR